MYPYLGDFPTGQTIYIPFHTFDSNDPSASVTISGLALSDIKIYKDGGVTQRSSTSGFTLLDTDGTDFDGVTGIHAISIDTSDDTDAGFFAAGSDYWVVINSITVDAATINFISATFSIDNRGLLRPTTAQRTLDVTATGAAGIDWGNIENAGTTVDFSATTIDSCDDVTGAVGSVTSGVSLAAGAVDNASLAGNMEIVFETDFATNYNATRNAWATNVQDTVGTGTLGLNDLSAAEVNAECDTAISDASLATALQLSNVDSNIASLTSDVGTVDANVDAILVDTGTDIPARFDGIEGGTFNTSTDSLEAIRNRGDSAWTTGAGGTPPQLLQNTTIATLASQTSFTLTAGSADDDAYNGAVVVVTDSSTSTQKAVGSVSDYTGSTKTVTLSSDPGVFTMAVGDTIDVIANASTAPSAAAVRAEMDSNSTQLAAIVADTNELQTDWANGGRLDNILDSRMAEASINTTAGAVDNVTLVATTTTNTDMRGTDSAALATALATAQSDLDTITGADGVNLLSATQASIDAILVDTGTTLPATLSIMSGDISSNSTDLGLVKTGIVDLGIQKNTARSDFEFPMKLSGAFVTGLTVTGQRSIDGAAFTNVSGTITEVGNGIYQFDALAADTNGDMITWKFSATGADDTMVIFKTVSLT